MSFRLIVRGFGRYYYSKFGKVTWYVTLTLIAMYCLIQVQNEKSQSAVREAVYLAERRQLMNVQSHLPIDPSDKNSSHLVNQYQSHLVNKQALTKPPYTRLEEDGSSLKISIPQCSPKSNLVYIKTHKTGSCTTTNMIFRSALKYDWPTLQFTYFPYPYTGIDKFYIHKHKFLESKGTKLRTKFLIAADHMRYERRELDKVMEGEPLYTTTLRYPPDHLRSMFSYFDLGKKLGIDKNIIDKSDVVEHYIQHRAKYKEPTLAFRVDNRNADTLGFNRSLANNTAEVDAFIRRVDREFGLVMIMEYSDESNILLRRKMCWDMADILYISINMRHYKNRQRGLKPELKALHRNWSNVDYLLYEHFNQSLWRQIQNEGDSFQQELVLYRKYVQWTRSYCQPMYDVLRKNKTQIYWLYNNLKPLTFPRTPFHEEFSIDVVFCSLAKVDIAQFYNIMKVHTFPQVCDFLDSHSPKVEVNKFKIYPKNKIVEMNKSYCAPNPEKTLVALEAIKTGLYF